MCTGRELSTALRSRPPLSLHKTIGSRCYHAHAVFRRSVYALLLEVYIRHFMIWIGGRVRGTTLGTIICTRLEGRYFMRKCVIVSCVKVIPQCVSITHYQQLLSSAAHV